MKAPNWALHLLAEAQSWATAQGYVAPNFKVTWGRRKGFDSSGCAGDGEIRIRAGFRRTDTKIVLLHEFAHQLQGIEEVHSYQFWLVLWRLYRWAKLPMRECMEREFPYRKKAKLAYYAVLRES